MKFALSAVLLAVLSSPVLAGGGFFFGPGGGGGGSSSTGTLVDGANARFTNVTVQTLTSTGTAPSATLNGLVSNASATILSGGLSVVGQSGIVVRIGTITNTASANPTQLSLGGPYNSSAAGNTIKSKLLIYDDGTSGAGLSFSSTGGGTLLEYNTSAGFDHAWFIGGSEKMRLKDVTGNVGVGTASPGHKIHLSSGIIYSDGNNAGLVIDRSQATDGAGRGYPLEIIGSALGAYSIIPFSKGATAMAYLGYGNSGSILTGANAGSFSIRAENDLHLAAGGNNLTATVTGGKVGIGTVSPATKLDVSGDAQFGSGVNKATITAGGFWQPLSQTTLQASLLAPTSLGQYIQNSTTNELCKSTGTSAGNWQKVDGGGGCF